jgi:hypothetical protein
MASVPAENPAARPDQRLDGREEEQGRASALSVLALQDRATDFARELSAQWPTIPDSLGLAMPRPEGEVGKALVYTINRFCAAQGETFSIDRLSENIEALAADAL